MNGIFDWFAIAKKNGEEVLRLREEVERLRAENANIRMTNEQIGRDNGSLQDDVERLRLALFEPEQPKVERLRAALEEIKSSTFGDPCTENDIDTMTSFVEELRDIARNALKGGAQ